MPSASRKLRWNCRAAMPRCRYSRVLSSQKAIFGLEDVEMQTIRACRLSDLIQHVEAPALMKIDVQGAELSVLRGSEELLQAFACIYVECSFMHLYAGQALASEVISWLAERNFHLCGVFNQYADRRMGPVQADFLFRRHGAEGTRDK